MSKIKLEKFEENFQSEINLVRSLKFKEAKQKEFLFPSYFYMYQRVTAVVFGMPALVAMFAFFFYSGGSQVDGNLAMLEDSNNRILTQINTLDE